VRAVPPNDLELPAEAVAQQLGHTDGGALVIKLYGHPDEELQRQRVAAALGQLYLVMIVGVLVCDFASCSRS